MIEYCAIGFNKRILAECFDIRMSNVKLLFSNNFCLVHVEKIITNKLKKKISNFRLKKLGVGVLNNFFNEFFG